MPRGTLALQEARDSLTLLIFALDTRHKACHFVTWLKMAWLAAQRFPNPYQHAQYLVISEKRINQAFLVLETDFIWHIFFYLRNCIHFRCIKVTSLTVSR